MAHEAIDERDPATILMEKECPEKDRRLYLQGIPCMETVRALGRFIKANPGKWNTFDARLENPEATQQQLADKLGVCQNTVHRHLSDVNRELKRINLLTNGGRKK